MPRKISLVVSFLVFSVLGTLLFWACGDEGKATNFSLTPAASEKNGVIVTGSATHTPDSKAPALPTASPVRASTATPKAAATVKTTAPAKTAQPGATVVIEVDSTTLLKKGESLPIIFPDCFGKRQETLLFVESFDSAGANLGSMGYMPFSAELSLLVPCGPKNEIITIGQVIGLETDKVDGIQKVKFLLFGKPIIKQAP